MYIYISGRKINNRRSGRGLLGPDLCSRPDGLSRQGCPESGPPSGKFLRPGHSPCDDTIGLARKGRRSGDRRYTSRPRGYT